MSRNGDAPNRQAGGVEPRQRLPLDCTRRRLFGWVLIFTVPFDVDERSIVERDRRLRDLAATDDWYRRIYTTPVAELDEADRNVAVDRYVDNNADADQVIRFLEGRCHACGK
jgi:hypothetical protein